MSHGRTTLIIAHRLATIRDADKIVLIADGRVADQGSHDQLIKANDAYRRLHDPARNAPPAGNVGLG